MKRFNISTGHEMPELNTISLPDLVFAFLFFIMIMTTSHEANLKVQVKVPQATEVQELKKQSLVTYIYVGKPTQELRGKMGSETRIQLNDQFVEIPEIQEYITQERASMKKKDAQYMTVSIKADKGTKMGIITDIKQALRKAHVLRISYSSDPGIQ